MSFRIEHGKVSDTAKLAAKAGAAEQIVRDNENATSIQKMILANTFQEEHDMRQMQHDINLRKWEQDINFEAEKAKRSWELEKQMMRSQQAFQLQLQDEAIQQRKLSQQLEAIQTSFNEGQISEDDAAQLRLRVQTGSFAPSTITEMRSSNQGIEDILAAIQGDTNKPAQLETRTIGQDDIASTVVMVDGSVKKFINGKLVTTKEAEPKPAKRIADMSIPELMNVEIPREYSDMSLQELMDVEIPEDQTVNLQQIQEQAQQPAYSKTGWGIFSKTSPNIPAMSAKLSFAAQSLDMPQSAKNNLQRAIDSNDPDLIKKYYERLVEANLLPKETPVKGTPVRTRENRQLTLPDDPFAGTEFSGV